MNLKDCCRAAVEKAVAEDGKEAWKSLAMRTSREPFMPSHEEIQRAIEQTDAPLGWVDEECSTVVQDFVRAAVEKAVAEAVILANKTYKRQESRHARELEIARLEARLDTVIWGIGAESLSKKDAQVFRDRISYLCARIAALRGEEKT